VYDALEVTLLKKFSHGFQAQGSYTWGKNIDTGSAAGIADPYTNSLAGIFWFCCQRGLADYNVAQNLTINYIWDVPTPNNWGSIVSHVLGGWEVGGIFTTHTGVPVTPLMSGDPLGTKSSNPLDFPNLLPGCSPVNPGNITHYINLSCFTPPTAPSSIAAQCQPGSFPGATTTAPGGQVYCANLLGNAGRNSIIGPGLVNLDFSLFKNNYIRTISETFNVQFRAEFFNVLNHANFETPFANNTLFSTNGAPVGGAGSLTSLATTARQIQFGLKLVW
jgi:hypothetical protein